MPDQPRRQLFGVSPVLVAVIAIVALVGAVLLGMSNYRMKPATNSARAMALASDEAKKEGAAGVTPASTAN